MKREIKFRAWLSDGEETFSEFMSYNLAFEEYAPINELLSKVKHLMQFTGLKDKNGKEIYEWDIVAFPRHGWEEDQFVDKIYWSNRAGGWNINSILAPTSEVIGNIYEHPELLEQ